MLQHSLLFQFKHGDHICVFYRTQDSLREILTPYIAEGLRCGERCFCAQKAETNKRLLFDLQFLGFDPDDAIRRGALELHTVDEVYFPYRKFEQASMIELLARSMEDAIARGFSALRTAGELSWAAQGFAGCDQLLTYEKWVDQYFPGRRVIGLCQYDVNAFTPDALATVIDAHRMHFSKEAFNSCHTGICFRSGNCWTEIVADKLVVSPSYYYVVQRHKSPDVLGWGVAPTFDTASHQAEQLVREAS